VGLDGVRQNQVHRAPRDAEETSMNSPRPSRAAEAHAPTSGEVKSYLSLVNDIVSRYSRRLPSCVLDGDLVAAGAAGVFDALRRCDGDRGPSFEGYVRTRIRGAIVDELRSQDWLTRAARRRATTWTEAQGAVPWGAVIRLDDLSENAPVLTDAAASPVDDLALQRDHAMLASAVASLPPRERVVVTLHYLHEVQLTAVAAELGVSVARASQLRARAIDALRSALAPESLERVPASAAESGRARPLRRAARKRRLVATP
jgi:RNA polymerase sigma factor for flagellar operon FliA